MRYKIGDIVEGVITGIKPYGAFVYIDSCHTGLIHISEISDYFVKDVHTFVKINEKVKVKILDTADYGFHFKLSLKALKSNKARMMRNHRYRHDLPKNKIGFSSLQAQLDHWIKKASEEIKND